MSHNLRASENNDYVLKVLLAELRKTIELYFFTQEQQQQQRRSNDDSNVSSSDENCKPFIDACLGILEHGLIVKQAADAGDVWLRRSNNDASTSSSTTQCQTIDATQLQKFTEDFEWLYTITQLRQNRTQSHSTYDKLRAKQRTSPASTTTSSSIHDFLYAWLWQSFETKSLCACLQALIADKELIELYYVESAFLQSDAYTNALCICVAAMELQQFNLLSQIDADLLQMAAALKHQKRTGSHPNLSFPEDKSVEAKTLQPNHSSDNNHKLELPAKCTQPAVPVVRKTKSLPLMPSTWLTTTPVARPRCKTLGTIGLTRRARTKPRTIPLTISTRMSSTASSSSFSQDELDMRPSTSNNSRSLLSPSGSHASSLNSTITARNIEIINCDNIKIWTDQSAEPTSSSGGSTSSPTGSSIRSSNLLLPPKAIGVKQGKSMSPLNSFFANLFGTPPTYTSWSPQHGGHDTQSDTLDLLNTTSAFPCNKQSSSPLSTSVFDAFMPTYGKKLRSRKSQNLFDENGISTLDYNSTNQDKTSPLWMPQAEEAIPNEEQQHQSESKPKSTQTLSDYLKRSHLSRNNTDLEKENAHFTISEAIITAMEHIKWAKTAPDKRRRLEDKNTTTATDWLEKEHNTKANARSHSASRELTGELAEHIPYAELGCFDELSAEIIGLTLISKFNDQQLPKVSELKWLVADEDTPQKLLPMPDETPSANPDEHVTPSMTRGTRYWAPPRQQIIFTDHPAHSRRELIKKQNYRCSGCGMRISPQNMHSFRYCTYFGKYHCTGCHRNQMSATPAKILQSWDFKCYPVSVFAYRLLDQMFTYPLFYVPDLNPALYTQTKVLHVARQKRRQLNFIKDIIRLCRFAQREQQYFQQIPNYISDDPDLWSMSDFIDVQDRSMKRSIEDLIAKCENHIHNCVLCTARGFYCEHCRKDHVIYPWENKVFRCDRCGSCYHMNCWRSIAEICYKCQRLNRRQAQEQFS